MKTGVKLKAVRGRIDITAEIGPLYRRDKEPEWLMYSYERPAYMLWNAIANALWQKGWTKTEIRDWLQSKETRWALDGSLGDALIKLGDDYAKEIERP